MIANTKMLSVISQYMVRKQETIAIAESVTAGLITSQFSSAENASQFPGWHNSIQPGSEDKAIES